MTSSVAALFLTALSAAVFRREGNARPDPASAAGFGPGGVPTPYAPPPPPVPVLDLGEVEQEDLDAIPAERWRPVLRRAWRIALLAILVLAAATAIALIVLELGRIAGAYLREFVEQGSTPAGSATAVGAAWRLRRRG